MSDQAASTDRTHRRAERYVRWFPRAWRERYGEEFTAYLEAAFADRPHDARRVIDIALHGVGARVTFVESRRRSVLALVAVTLVTLLTLAGVTASRYFAPVALSGNASLSADSIGIVASARQVSDVEFFFNAPARARIHVTSLRIIGVRGFAVPSIVGAGLVSHANPHSLLNTTSWPPRYPKGTTYGQQFKLQAVINHSVILGHENTLWVGFRTPAPHVAYAIDGFTLGYEVRGVTHDVTFTKGSLPDVIYVERVPNEPGATSSLDAQQRVASDIVKASTPTLTPNREALAVARAAADGAFIFNRAATIRDVRDVARRFFPASNGGGIRSVTLVRGVTPHWRMVTVDPTTGRTLDECVSTGVFDATTRSLAGPYPLKC